MLVYTIYQNGNFKKTLRAISNNRWSCNQGLRYQLSKIDYFLIIYKTLHG